jgi:hypothetical protein
MEERLISVYVARLAKEAGFDWYCKGGYLRKSCTRHSDDPEVYSQEFELVKECDYLDKIPLHEPYYDAPTFSHLQAWIRKVHNIHVCPTVYRETMMDRMVTGYFVGEIFDKDGKEIGGAEDWNYPEYDEALERGLIIALKIIIKNKSK